MHDLFNALTTYDPLLNDTGWKGMAIKSSDGGKFQINGFYYSNFGETNPISIDVKGYRDGVEVASTSFLADDLVDEYRSKNVVLDSTFDNVDKVFLYSAGLSWHGINNIVIDQALTNAAAPSITTQPTDQTVNEGSVTTLNVAATGSASLSYQWYSNSINSTSGGVLLNGKTNATMTVPTAAPGTTYYYAVVTNTDSNTTGNQTATATSSAAKVTVNALTNAAVPSITTQPIDQTVNEGSVTTLTVAASGSPALSYQWYSNTTNSASGGTLLSGETNAALTVPTATVGTTYYYAVVTNTDNSATGNKTATATSSAAKVIVNALTNAAVPSITTQPIDQTVNEGSVATLTVAASGSPALSYQWYSNTTNSTSGGSLLNGETNAILTVPTAMPGIIYYYAKVTNTDSNATGNQTATAISSVVKVTVNALTYTIDPISAKSAAVLISGYVPGSQETKTITITRDGTGDLIHLAVSLTGEDFVVTEPALTTLTTGTPTTNFTIKAKDGLAAGTYTTTVTVSADHMANVAFTVTQVVNLPGVPANPKDLVAIGGDRQVALNWSSVTEATYYNVYMATADGQYNSSSFTTVTTAAYIAENLTNGTNYFFVVKAGNVGGLSAASNQVSATPAKVAGAPTSVTAVAGNGQATITFAAPTDNGGNEITAYEVTGLPDGIKVTGAASPITITGLTNQKAYTFTVKAINRVGSSISSAASSEVIPSAPSENNSGDSGSGSGGTSTSVPAATGIEVLVNGKVENLGTATAAKRDEQTVTTVSLDQNKVESKLAEEGQHTLITIPIVGQSNVVIGEMNGQLIKNMQNKQAVLAIKTDGATYTLPAEQINIAAISEQFGKALSLGDIKVQIEIATLTAEAAKVVENAAEKGTFTLVAPSINFTVRGIYGNETIEMSKFNAFVERTIAIPEGVDPNKITTAIVVDPDGTVRHVPTKVVQMDGNYFAKVNSMTNSTYSVIWHPIAFADMENHWAKDAVNNMGSRMVIEGTGGSLFSPDREITRAEFTAIVVRGMGLKLEKGTAPFTDVKASDWYSSAINTAYGIQLISGFDTGEFHPNDKITREQAMVIIAKAMKMTELKAKLSAQAADAALRPYLDADKAANWAQNSIADCLQAGIVTGRSDKALAPKALITRAEVAVIVQKLLQKSDFIK
ncbi:S-layer homology domain-containing protein [Paenibacillus sp. HWE-109]|uniref:S-layer homology domain-containing protein n=1 Tax=Paenibacillus sp. HWE-109 TaxID=1306526 RepID=UPI001EDDA259|nr:S-layer homology domain-containing protein [Paenibacillus sp. HWE-109]UKS24487.1 S-layer homology domain-containing protein [Paenibacillus sp. HWE-109]